MPSRDAGTCFGVERYNLSNQFLLIRKQDSQMLRILLITGIR